jgi:hypothetical protein
LPGLFITPSYLFFAVIAFFAALYYCGNFMQAVCWLLVIALQLYQRTNTNNGRKFSGIPLTE